MKQVENRHLTDVWAVLVQGHGRIIAHDFCVAHREANSGLSTLNRTKSILSIYHQQRQLQKQRGMCLNDTYPFCQQPLSGNCHSICFSKPVLWTATPRELPFLFPPGLDIPHHFAIIKTEKALRHAVSSGKLQIHIQALKPSLGWVAVCAFHNDRHGEPSDM